MRHADAVCGNKWEYMGVISYVRLRFVVRMQQTELIHVEIQNVSTYESDMKFEGLTSLYHFLQMADGISGKE